MNAYIREALRRAGAEAGVRARRDAGLPNHIEDQQVLQRLAEMLIKAGGRREAEGAAIQHTDTPPELTYPVNDLTTALLPLRRALSYGQQQRARKLA